MNEPVMPKSYKTSSKPSNFCPGCGHSLVLKNLGFVIDELRISKKTVFATDIGCSLLAWDFYDLDTVQSHHGRAGCISTGLKKALPKSVVIAYMGDGGGYSIGLHHLIHLAKRNEPVTVI
jgi:2-oxoglutarate ferredoxin oxidoreductase subunit beta